MRRLVLLLLALVMAGCGVGAGEADREATVTVTRDFGAERLGSRSAKVPESETVMRFTTRSFETETRYGGGFVQSIEGLDGGDEDGRPVDWFYFVNGVEAEVGAASTRLSPGDRVWWDRRDWGGAMRVPAVVGSFPEPFRSGIGGRKLPVRLDCADEDSRECDDVAARLSAAGVKGISKAVVGAGVGENLLHVVVGPWAEIRKDYAAQAVERGPQTSGVFASFDAQGRRLTLLDGQGREAKVLGPGGGLIAATRLEKQQATWLVTGVDTAGVAAAAALLTEDALRDRYALAVEAGRPIPVPVRPAPLLP